MTARVRALPATAFALLFVATVSLPPVSHADVFGVDVGSVAPEVSIAEYVRGAPGPGHELERRVRLVHVFRTWSTACEEQVAQLDDLHARFADKGLDVLAVTDEPVARVRAFVERTHAQHPVAVESGDSAAAFGLITGVPTAFLVDTRGVLRWKGNWAEESAAVLQRLLPAARLLPRIPDELADVERLLREERFAALSRRIGELERGEPDPQVSRAVQSVRTFVEGLGRDRIDESHDPLDAGHWYETWLVLDEVRERFEGFEASKAAERAIRELLSVTEQRVDVKAGRAYYDALARIEEMSAKKAAETLRRVLFPYRDTRFWALALPRVERLEAE